MTKFFQFTGDNGLYSVVPMATFRDFTFNPDKQRGVPMPGSNEPVTRDAWACVTYKGFTLTAWGKEAHRLRDEFQIFLRSVEWEERKA